MEDSVLCQPFRYKGFVNHRLRWLCDLSELLKYYPRYIPATVKLICLRAFGQFVTIQ
jgi:hypothetical protein